MISKNRKPKVLHVDDDTDFLRLFGLFFKSKMEIESVEKPEEALKAIKSDRFDAVVTDYDMPIIDGLELLKKIKSQNPLLPVIFYTGQGSEKIAREAFTSGASDYFTKDITGFVHKEKLYNSVLRAMESQLMEKSEKEATSRYLNIFENIRDVYFEIDTSGKILEISPSVNELIGYERDKLLDTSFIELFTEPDQGRLFITEVTRQKVIPDYEIRILSSRKDTVHCSVNVNLTYGETKNEQKLIGSLHNITKRKQAEEALSSRIIALTQPLDQVNGISIHDLFNIEELQEIQDLFAKSTSVASMITYPDGTPLTRPSNFCHLCQNIIRGTEKGRFNCKISDSLIGRQNMEGPIIQPCLSGGLWDAGASISVGVKHVANWLVGQVRNEAQDPEQMRKYSREIGADEEEFMKAFNEVPVMSRERFEQIAQTLFVLAKQLSTLAYQNVQQARFIAERIKAEEALREKSQELEKFFSSTLELLCIADTDGYFHRTNQEWEKILGYTKEELDGRKFLDLVHPDDVEATLNAMETLNNQKEVMNFINRYRHKNGDYRWIEWRSFPVGNKIYASARDITQKRQQEEALRQSEATLSSIFRVAPAGIGLIKNRIIQKVNKHFCDMTGYSPEDVIGKNSRILYPTDEDYQFVGEEKYRQIKENGTGTVESRWLNKDGRIIDILLSSTPLDVNDLSLGVTFTAVDITNTKKVERELKRERERYELATRAGKVGVYDWDLKTGISHLDSVLKSFMGVDQVKLPINATQWIDYVHQDDLEELQEKLSAHLDGHTDKFELEYRLKHIDGFHRWVLCQGEAIRDEAGEPMRLVGTVTDITDSKKHQMVIETQRRQLLSMFDNLDEIVYVSDPETYELLYINDPGNEFYGGKIGDKCYRVLQEKDSPCEFCTNHIIFDEKPGEPYIWEFQNLKTGRYYHCIDRAIPWESGRMVRFEVAVDVTNLKKIQEKLKVSEEKFRNLYLDAPLGYQSLGANGRFLEVNKTWTSLTGYSREEIIGRWFGDLLTPEYQKLFPERFELFKKQGKISSIDFDIIRKDGSTMNASFEGTIMKNSAGDFLRTHCIMMDVTQQKTNQKKLQWELALNQALANLSNALIKPDPSLEEISRIVLDSAKKLTGSQNGYVCTFDPQNNHVINHTLSDKIKIVSDKMQDENTAFQSKPGSPCHKLSEHSIILKESFYTNDPQNHPAFPEIQQFHIPTSNFLSTPVFIGNLLSGQIALANKPGGFTRSDLSGVGRLARLFALAVERKRFEDSLKHSEEKFRGIAECSFDVIFTTDIRGIITYISPSAKNVFGYSSDEMIGKHFVNFSIEEEKETNISHFRNVTEKGERIITSVTAAHINGKKFTIELSISPLRKDSIIKGIQGIIRDVSQREQAQQRLSQLNYMFLKLGPNPQVNINSITKTLGELLGADCALYNRIDQGLLCAIGKWQSPPGFKPIDNPEGHICYDVITWNKPDEIYYITDLQSTEYAKTDPNVAQFGLKTYIGYPIKAGNRVVGSLCVVFTTHHTLTTQDEWLISLLAKAISIEEEREESRQLLVDKNRQLEDFAHRVSHDLKGPIRNLGGYTGLLQKDSPEFEYFKEKMNKQIDQLISLIDRLLELSRAGRVLGSMNRFPLNDLLDKILESHSGDEITVTPTYRNKPGLIYGDQASIENVLANIIENAIRYRNKKTDQVSLNFTYNKTDDATIVTITDNGPGIDKENLERIFEPGLALEKNRGTGFGLAICRKIIEAHGGTITAQSPGKGKGTTFTIHLPFPMEQPQVETAPVPPKNKTC